MKLKNCQESSNIYYTKVGEYFGYPSCCINSFINFVCNEVHRTPNQLKASDGTGFIPCICHSDKIMNGEATLESILIDRKSLSKFPNDSSQADMEYINSLKL